MPLYRAYPAAIQHDVILQGLNFMFKRLSSCSAFLPAFLLLASMLPPCQAEGPYQATGFKVGEVTSSTAIVWTRLSLRPERNGFDLPMVEIRYATNSQGRRKRAVEEIIYPNDVTVSDIRDAVPGTVGQVRVLFRPKGVEKWQQTDWESVDPGEDFTQQFQLRKLTPGITYDIQIDTQSSPDGKTGQSLEGSFQTAPLAKTPARVVFTVSTGQAYNDRDDEQGYEIYPTMLNLKPNFFVHTGDIIYYDRLAKTEALAHYHWQRTYSLPTNVLFHRQVSSYFIKDDHDSWVNDCWPTMKTKYMHDFTFVRGLKIFRHQVPMGRSTYRTRRWGKDLQIWMVEGRDFRSANTDPDGPEKTIWGEKQKEWFKRTVRQSDATFKVLVSPTPLVGPDRDNKNDNHANKGFTHEGNELREFIASQQNMVVVCGDRHWQYMSVDPRTGTREYSCGPASDKHAGGWQQDDYRKEYHRYLNVTGGFLSATVERKEGTPSLTFRYHDSDGTVNFTDVLNPH
jgi:alkaline phosphatase D